MAEVTGDWHRELGEGQNYGCGSESDSGEERIGREGEGVGGAVLTLPLSALRPWANLSAFLRD